MRNMVRASLLLALMIVLQSLRLFMPVPPIVSLFVIGSAVNACLLAAAETAGLAAACLIAALAAVVAFFQQALPLPVFMVPVAITNVAYVLAYAGVLRHSRRLAVLLSGVVRFLVLYTASDWAFALVELPPLQAAALQAAMGWPQLFTGIAGGVLWWLVFKRLRIS